jgi:hypothetical protein
MLAHSNHRKRIRRRRRTGNILTPVSESAGKTVVWLIRPPAGDVSMSIPPQILFTQTHREKQPSPDNFSKVSRASA